jgi:hypothetical protein
VCLYGPPQLSQCSASMHMVGLPHALRHPGTCQNDSEDECANECPAQSASTLEETHKSAGAKRRRQLLGTRADPSLLHHLFSGMGALDGDSQLSLGPVDTQRSISSGPLMPGKPRKGYE